MDAIVYVSETGFTKKYAEMLSAELDVQAMTLKDAANKLSKGSEIIYMGWVSAGFIKGLSKAMRLYEVKAVGGVGMGRYTEKNQNNLVKQNKLADLPAFYLQGGFDMGKLRGFNKVAMKIMGKVVASSIKNGKESMMPKEQAEEMLDAIRHSKDYVSADKLQPMLERCKTL
ncbi:MAG: hypothetical protein PHI19_02215 [Clostridia bacterium]|nr:hypothetical protein [Clostridia bacterium]